MTKEAYLKPISELPSIILICHELGLVLFWVNHWLFTAHYLKVACLIRLSLTGSDLLEQSQKFKCWRTVLLAIDIVLYTAMLTIFLVAQFKREWGQNIVHIVWAALLWVVTFVSFWSMKYIYM